MARLLHQAKTEALSYVFFAGLIATTFLL